MSISSDLGKFLAGQHSVSIVVDGVEEGCIGRRKLAVRITFFQAIRIIGSLWLALKL